MVTVRFYGDLKQFGTSFKLDVKSVPEAIRALTAQIPGLRKYIADGHFKVKADGEILSNDNVDHSVERYLHITPVVVGASKNPIGQIIVGAILIVASLYMPGIGATAAKMMMSMGMSLALGGVAQLLTKTPSMGSASDSDDLKSTSFSSLDNMAAQGAPVPIIYGKIMVGSRVLSQGLRSYYSGAAGDGQNGGSNEQTNKDKITAMFVAGLRKEPIQLLNGYNFDSSNETVKNRNYTAVYKEES